MGHLCSGTGTAFAAWAPLGQLFWLSGSSNAPHSLTSLSGYKTMGQSVYAGSEMTLPSPHPQTGLSGQYLLELEVQGATSSALGQCADQQAEEDDEARMGKITSISLRIMIGTGCAHLPTCDKWAGGPSLLCSPVQEPPPAWGHPRGGHRLWLGSPWVGEWQGDGCMGWAGLQAQRVRVSAEGRPEGAF